jgi:hypothetical protein
MPDTAALLRNMVSDGRLDATLCDEAAKELDTLYAAIAESLRGAGHPMSSAVKGKMFINMTAFSKLCDIAKARAAKQ